MTIYIALLLGLAACGGGGGSADGTTIYTSEQLQSILVTVDDLPNGWAAMPDENSNDNDDDDQICGAEPALADVETDGHEAEANFSKAMLGPFVVQVVVSVSESDAKVALDHLKEEWDCGEYTSAEGDTVTVQTIKFKDLGDETIAFRLQSEGGEQFPFQADYVYIRVGGVVTGLGYAGVMGSDFDELERLAEVVADRMGDLD